MTGKLVIVKLSIFVNQGTANMAPSFDFIDVVNGAPSQRSLSSQPFGGFPSRVFSKEENHKALYVHRQVTPSYNRLNELGVLTNHLKEYEDACEIALDTESVQRNNSLFAYAIESAAGIWELHNEMGNNQGAVIGQTPARQILFSSQCCYGVLPPEFNAFHIHVKLGLPLKDNQGRLVSGPISAIRSLPLPPHLAQLEVRQDADVIAIRNTRSLSALDRLAAVANDFLQEGQDENVQGDTGANDNAQGHKRG